MKKIKEIYSILLTLIMFVIMLLLIMLIITKSIDWELIKIVNINKP